MTIKTQLKTILAATAIAAVGVTGAAHAASGADTKVSIKGQEGDYYGYVKSADADNCANERKVTVFKQLGATQDPRNDQKIGSDIAQPNGTKYMWAIGNSGYKSGDFYAKAAKVEGLCKAATSKTISR